MIVPANHFAIGLVAKANELLTPYGLRMTDAEPGGRTPRFELKGAVISRDALTEGVKQVNVFRPSPTAVTDKAQGRILVAAPHYPGQGFVAVAKAGKGEVVAVGDSLWWYWIGGNGAADGGSDNARLLQNLLSKPNQKK